MIHIIDYINTDLKHMDHWQTVVPEFLRSVGYEVNVIGGVNPHKTYGDWNLLGEIYYKTSQFINIYDGLAEDGNVSDGDIFLISDAWNPTMISLNYIRWIMDYDVTFVAFWRDGIFDKNGKIRWGMLRKDKSWAKTFERSLYSSYEYNLFLTEDQKSRFLGRYKLKDSDTTIASGLPYSHVLKDVEYDVSEKENIIVLPHDAMHEDQRGIWEALKNYMSDYKFIDCHELQLRRNEYYDILKKAKAIMAINLSETDAISIVEGMAHGCVPIVPDDLVYADVIPDKYQFNAKNIQPPMLNFIRSRESMFELVQDVMENYLHHARALKEEISTITDTYYNSDRLLEIIKKIEKEKV